jgi:hypothetical protein
MVRVISKEFLKLPDTVTGHVLLKNQLCTQGVLAISIGVVDPGFEGPISSTLINFGREICEINKGDAFLRVSFLRCQQSPKALHSQKNTREGYVRKARQEVQAYSGPTFLSMETMTAKAAEEAFKSFRNGVLEWATVFGVVIALLAVFAPLGASYVDKYVSSRDSHDAELEQKIEKEVGAQYDLRIKALSSEIEVLTHKPEETGHKNATANRQ